MTLGRDRHRPRQRRWVRRLPRGEESRPERSRHRRRYEYGKLKPTRVP
jgi:hypothetical protein